MPLRIARRISREVRHREELKKLLAFVPNLTLIVTTHQNHCTYEPFPTPTLRFEHDSYKGQDLLLSVSHDIAHYMVATPRERRMKEFGLGSDEYRKGSYAKKELRRKINSRREDDANTVQMVLAYAVGFYEALEERAYTYRIINSRVKAVYRRYQLEEEHKNLYEIMRREEVAYYARRLQKGIDNNPVNVESLKKILDELKQNNPWYDGNSPNGFRSIQQVVQKRTNV